MDFTYRKLHHRQLTLRACLSGCFKSFPVEKVQRRKEGNSKTEIGDTVIKGDIKSSRETQEMSYPICCNDYPICSDYLTKKCIYLHSQSRLIRYKATCKTLLNCLAILGVWRSLVQIQSARLTKLRKQFSRGFSFSWESLSKSPNCPEFSLELFHLIGIAGHQVFTLNHMLECRKIKTQTEFAFDTANRYRRVTYPRRPN